MGGTVIIKLKDYEELKAMAEVGQSLMKKSRKAIELLEKVEDFLKVEKIETELIGEISEELDKWYG